MYLLYGLSPVCLTEPQLFVILMNYPTKERPQYHVKQTSRFDKRNSNTNSGKITAFRNSSVKRSFLLLLLYKILWADADETGRQTNVLYTSFGINICQKVKRSGNGAVVSMLHVVLQSLGRWFDSPLLQSFG